MRTKLLIIAVSLIITHISITGSIADQLSEPEKIAQKYMTAFFRGDLELSFSLMHPDVLEKQKSSIIEAYDNAKKDGNGEKFRKSFHNIDDLDSTLQLPAKEFFIFLTKRDRERAPEQYKEAMKNTVVRVLGSSSLENDGVSVSLEVTTPTKSGPHKQSTGLVLSKYDDNWRVVKNAK
jgi:hypothetical protein